MSKQKGYKEVLYSLDLRRFGTILRHNQIAVNWAQLLSKNPQVSSSQLLHGEHVQHAGINWTTHWQHRLWLDGYAAMASRFLSYNEN